MNGNDNNYYLDPSIYSTKDELAIDGVFAICSQVPINYHSGLNQPSFGAAQLAAKSHMQNSYVDSKNLMHLSQMESLTGPMNHYDIRNTRKRPIDNTCDFQQRSPEDTIDNKPSETGWPPNKKMSLCFQGQSQDHFFSRDMKDIQRDKVPARRSQKLADRITALQKLVSPYGKTDTASVLQEASLFIKALLDQIENMSVKANPSPGDNENSHQINEDKQYDLQEKGLCLVPVSMTQKLVREDTMYPYSTMTNPPISPEDLSTFM